MEKLEYRDLIKKIVQQYAKEQLNRDDRKAQMVFDSERDVYLLLNVGWQDEERIHGCPIHIEILENKIWIQRDFTEEGLAQQFVELGVPKTDIVLGFRCPYVRQFTEFAVA